VDRIRSQRGKCGASAEIRIASADLHFGEEAPVSGNAGSGTIFFSHCSLSCAYCQNYDLSQLGTGTVVGIQELAGIMVTLQQRGALNINLVTPTHYLPGILSGLDVAAANGLDIPVLYNSSGWEQLDVLACLDGIIDIYMPDCKYSVGTLSTELSDAPGYPERVRAALAEMYRQVGPLELDREGHAVRGLLVRHLILPGHTDNTMGVIQLLEDDVPGATLSILSQYHPCYRAETGSGELSRFVNQEERQSIDDRLSKSPLAVIRQWH